MDTKMLNYSKITLKNEKENMLKKVNLLNKAKHNFPVTSIEAEHHQHAINVYVAMLDVLDEGIETSNDLEIGR